MNPMTVEIEDRIVWLTEGVVGDGYHVCWPHDSFEAIVCKEQTGGRVTTPKNWCLS